jgi:hypothetical protein
VPSFKHGLSAQLDVAPPPLPPPAPVPVPVPVEPLPAEVSSTNE